MKNLFIFIIFIIITIIGIKNTVSFFSKTTENEIRSYQYFIDKVKDLSSDINTINERQRLGLEIDKKELELLEYKRSFFNGIDGVFYKATTPCYTYCLNAVKNNTEDSTNCLMFKREVMLEYGQSIVTLKNEHQKLINAHKSGQISSKEYKELKEKIKEKNQSIINEIDKILSLKEIPQETTCSLLNK